MTHRMAFLGLAGALALAGCDTGTVPSPAERLEGAGGAAAEAVDPDMVALNGEGLAVGPEAFFYAAGQTEVETALSRVLGKPGESREMGECGAGPMTGVAFADSLTVNFQQGRLVGWVVGSAVGGGPDNIAIVGGPAIGMPRADVEALPGFAMIEGSTLGEEFMLGDTLGGFFEDGKVAMLYAGTQCFFR